MVSASAPGKVILFGEHAVVSGASAIGGAIDLRAKVTIENLPGSVLIEAHNIPIKDFSIDLVTGKIESVEASNAMKYVSAALDEFDSKNLRVKIESDLPPASGLGSSAAIVVATIAAINGYLQLEMSKKEIAFKAHKIERSVQNGLGSPMDTALATFGGFLKIGPGIQPIDLPSMQLVVGCTRQPHDTRIEVEKVQRLKSRWPGLLEPIFEAIGAISARAVPLIQEQHLAEIGELMNVNHGLLEALGVGTRELCELVYAARGAGGAYGAKITGAGGGGCMIALPRPGGASNLITAIKQGKGLAFPVRVGLEGVRMEAGI